MRIVEELSSIYRHIYLNLTGFTRLVGVAGAGAPLRFVVFPANLYKIGEPTSGLEPLTPAPATSWPRPFPSSDAGCRNVLQIRYFCVNRSLSRFANCRPMSSLLLPRSPSGASKNLRRITGNSGRVARSSKLRDGDPATGQVFHGEAAAPQQGHSDQRLPFCSYHRNRTHHPVP
jgi:hypothetical protein